MKNLRNGFLIITTLFYVALMTSSAALAASSDRAKKTSEAKAAKQDLTLIKGLQSNMDLAFEPCGATEECIRVANKGIVSVQYSKEKKQLIFSPQARGETTVTVRDEKGDIRLIMKAIVSEVNITRRLEELKLLLRDIEGIEMKILGDKIVIDGEVMVLGDLNRLYHVISDDSYKALVLNLTGISPVAMQIMSDQIQAQIGKPGVRVKPMNNSQFLVEGQVENASEADSVAAIARNMVQGFLAPKFTGEANSPFNLNKPKVLDPIIVRLSFAPAKPKPPIKMVRVTIDFVELSKDYLRNFGFSLAPTLTTGGSVSFGTSTTGGVTSQGNGSLSGTIDNLFPKLSTAQNAGYARILEESVMIAKSGTDVKFERQLDVPIQVAGASGGTDFKKQVIGPKIFVRPTIQGQSEDIELTLDFSYAGFAGKQGAANLILNHQYKTIVIVKSGESAAIVNALSNAIATAFNKDPPGGSLPANPLFTLFRSKSFQKSKSQFVVFVTPQVIESASTGTEDIKHKYGLKRKQQ